MYDDDESAPKQQEEARLLLESQDADLREILDRGAGRRVLWRLLEHAGVFRSAFSADPYATAFNEGRRSSGLFLLNEVERASPGALGAMMKEFSDER